MIRTKWDLDEAQAALGRELEKLAALKKGLDGERASLNQWGFSWEGIVSWDGGTVQMNCRHHAKAVFRTNSKDIRGRRS